MIGRGSRAGALRARRVPPRSALVVLAVLARAPASRADAAPAPATPLAVERYALASGLEVVLAPDPTVTTVIVEVWHAAGSGDERADERGAAHALERALADHTRHTAPGAGDALVERAGGWTTASTTVDRIAFVVAVPSPQLPLAMWLEADRLAALAAPIAPADLERARVEVAAARRAIDDRPYGAAELAGPGLLWPAEHPYAHGVIGDEVASAAAIERFRAAHLAPARARLIVCGGFAPARARALIAAHFGALAARAPAPAVAAEVAPRATRHRGAWKDDRAAPAVTMTWRAPAAFAPGAAELELAAAVLGGGPSSRLARHLIERDRLATEIDVAFDGHARGGEVALFAVAADGVSAARLAAALDAELAAFRRAPPTADEVARAQLTGRARSLAALENLASRADALARWVSAHEGGDFVTGDQARLARVDRAAVARAIATWLGAAASVDARIDREAR